MKANEDTVRENALSLLDDIESDEGDLHSQHRTEDVEGRVSNVETLGVAAYS